MVNGLAKYGIACTMAYGPSMLTQASSCEERLLPSDGDSLPERSPHLTRATRLPPRTYVVGGNTWRASPQRERE